MARNLFFCGASALEYYRVLVFDLKICGCPVTFLFSLSFSRAVRLATRAQFSRWLILEHHVEKSLMMFILTTEIGRKKLENSPVAFLRRLVSFVSRNFSRSAARLNYPRSWASVASCGAMSVISIRCTRTCLRVPSNSRIARQDCLGQSLQPLVPWISICFLFAVPRASLIPGSLLLLFFCSASE